MKKTTEEIIKELQTRKWNSPEEVDKYFEKVLNEKDKEIERLVIINLKQANEWLKLTAEIERLNKLIK